MIISKTHYKQIKYLILSVFGVLLFFAWHGVAAAEYQQVFTISAYYSPIPGQARYVTGSLAGDIRLNGSGVNSADGTPVYPGMIAAPRKYPFGTKMSIPGIGLVAVHDRGGAIVSAGYRGQSYDRLDVWMGYGDAGLSRAMNWGKRRVQVTVYGVNPAIKENVYLEGYTLAEKFVKNVVNKQRIFTNDLWYGTSGDDVNKLQQYLKDLSYYKGEINGVYGDVTYKAVIAFQIDQGIIDRKEEFGAGYFGPRTRERLEAVLEQRKKDKLIRQNLGRDDSGEDVKKLQESLKKLGYDIEATGVYDEQTIEAVYEFQKQNNIVNNENDLGAGYFGPKTLSVLSQKMLALEENSSNNIQENTIVQAEFDAFTRNLTVGNKGEDVKRLQEELRKMSFLRIEPSGYYGAFTEHAVYKFQQRKGIITSKIEFGAGVFGPKTRDAFNAIVGHRANTDVLIARNTENFKNISQKVAEINSDADLNITNVDFTNNLNLGTVSEDVELLQKALRQLGFYDSDATSNYFGDNTREAVIAFQLDNNIISSRYEYGAGYLGPETRAKLNEVL